MTIIRSIETFTHDLFTVVRVRGDDGSEGFGQTAGSNPDITAEVLHRQAAPHALGRDVDDIDGLIERCYAREAKFLGSYLARALAGVDTALWDLRAKRVGLSVSALLGGKMDRIPVYGSYQLRNTQPADAVARLKQARDQYGYEAFKIKIGKRRGRDEDQWPGRTPTLIRSVRQAFGNEVCLLADANSGYTPKHAIAIGRMLEEHGYQQFEEPCPHQELEWTAEVTAALALDVCGGEQDYDMAQFRRMVKMQAVDVVQPDIGYVGGFTLARQVAEIAAEANLVCQPHSGNRSMLMVFALHLFASLRNPGPFAECAVDPPPAHFAMYSPTLTVTDGYVRLPDGPGWGVMLNREWISKAKRRVSVSDDRRGYGVFRKLRRLCGW